MSKLKSSKMKFAIHLVLAMALTIISLNCQAWESIPGQFVVKIKKTLVSKADADLGLKLNAMVVKQIRRDVYVLQRPVVEREEYALKTLNNNEDIEIAEPNYVYRATRVPNDPRLTDLWGMKNTGANDSAGIAGIAGVDIGAEKAWDIQTGSKNVLVAVIDTGIDFSIADLKNQRWLNQAEVNGKPGVDDDKNGYIDDISGWNFAKNKADATDDNGHGSHCAGTIGGEGNNGQGVVGVNWNVSMVPVKFLDASGSGTLDNAILAIDYATSIGATILNNSWGGGGPSELLKQSIERSRDAGALFVAAAGNDSADNDAVPHFPASYDVDNVLSVAAVDNRGELANFSCWGARSVHIAAPGLHIWSTTPKGIENYSGTSMATPHVAGIAALLKANEPNITYSEIKDRLLSTARPLFSLSGKVSSGGLADAYYALTNQKPPPDPNDPTNLGQITSYSLSTAHPYGNKETQDFKIDIPGARRMSIHFKKFKTENGYDQVQFLDRAGKVLATWTGDKGDRYTPVFDGDQITLRFTSDASVTDYGFDVDLIRFD